MEEEDEMLVIEGHKGKKVRELERVVRGSIYT